MKRAIALLIILSIAQPVYAGIVTEFEPVEQELIETERELEKQLEESLKVIDKKKKSDEEKQQAKVDKTPKSKKWYWIIGGLLIAGGAAAAGGGSSSSDGGDTGTVVVSY